MRLWRLRPTRVGVEPVRGWGCGEALYGVVLSDTEVSWQRSLSTDDNIIVQSLVVNPQQAGTYTIDVTVTEEVTGENLAAVSSSFEMEQSLPEMKIQLLASLTQLDDENKIHHKVLRYVEKAINEPRDTLSSRNQALRNEWPP